MRGSQQAPQLEMWSRSRQLFGEKDYAVCQLNRLREQVRSYRGPSVSAVRVGGNLLARRLRGVSVESSREQVRSYRVARCPNR